ncbi:MAG: NTP transferase domain-containing protein [Coriobacteriia bacterium]|nr:NTP transferase domain-containing protein [Coriobacteriia bacterium]
MSATALILAAGEGTRMKSSLPKVAHRILGLPMVEYAIRATREAGCERVVVVTGHEADAVEALIDEVTFARQEQRLGTGHAVMCAADALKGATGSLLVVAGDCPLLTAETLAELIQSREKTDAACSLLTARLVDPSGYGRIVRAGDGSVAGIVEDKDLTGAQRGIDEVNTSTYCFDIETLFTHLRSLGNDNAQGEYYLTDMIALFRREGLGVVAVEATDPDETLGVNSRVQLAEAARVLQRRINECHMLSGVTMTDPGLAWISPDVTIGRDTVVEPMTFLFGTTSVGERCELGPNVRVTDSQVGDGCTIRDTVLTESVLADGASAIPCQK